MYLPVVIRDFIHVNWDEYLDIRSRLDVMKNTMYIKKYLMQLISLSQKGYFILYNENKITLHFNKSCFIGPQNQRFRCQSLILFQPVSFSRPIIFLKMYPFEQWSDTLQSFKLGISFHINSIWKQLNCVCSLGIKPIHGSRVPFKTMKLKWKLAAISFKPRWVNWISE